MPVLSASYVLHILRNIPAAPAPTTSTRLRVGTLLLVAMLLEIVPGYPNDVVAIEEA
jgi:hypothetical protein